jgi:hypothetical protein
MNKSILWRLLRLDDGLRLYCFPEGEPPSAIFFCIISCDSLTYCSASDLSKLKSSERLWEIHKRIHIRNLSPFDVHIWLPESEWVDVGARIEVSKAVVDESVRTFVGSHRIQNVKQFGIRTKTPVVDGYLGCRFI